MLSRTVVPLAAALCLTACSGLNEVQFDTAVTGKTVIPASSGILQTLTSLPGFGGFANLDFDSLQEFQNQGVTKDDVESVTITSFRLKILSPADADFRFLDTLRFTAKAGSQEALVAEKTGIADLTLPPPNPTLELDLFDVELKPFVTAPSMSLQTSGSGRQPPKETTLEATVNLRVKAKVL